MCILQEILGGGQGLCSLMGKLSLTGGQWHPQDQLVGGKDETNMQTAESKLHILYGTFLKKQNNQKIRSGGWSREGMREEGRREKEEGGRKGK